jgi:hypothetical protein
MKVLNIKAPEREREEYMEPHKHTNTYIKRGEGLVE